MYVQRIRTKDDKIRYILLDDNYQVIEVVKNFLKHLDDRRHAENTLKNYAYHMKLYFEFLKEEDLDYKGVVDENLELRVLSKFMAWLNTLDEKVIYTQYSERPTRRTVTTINTIMSAVLSFYDYLCRTGEVRELNIYKLSTFSPFKSFYSEMGITRKQFKTNILKLKDTDRKLVTVSRDEVSMLISKCKSIRDKLLISILYESGLRLGEALGLRKSDIVIWDNKLKIVSRDNRENGVSVKNKAEGEIIIPQYICQLYCKYLEQEYINNENDYVFVNLKGRTKGSAMKPITVQKLFERLSIQCGIKVNPHMLRHSHASELIEVGGWDPLDVKERLRHRQIQTTINTYIHLSDSYKKQQFKEFENKLRKGEDSDSNK